MKKLTEVSITLLMLGALRSGVIGQPSASTNQPSRQPALRIETGMHTAPIRRISVDAANRYLVTASHDKTARVWELATGKLLRVLRPPIGEGHEGKLYAVAISPNGRTVAVGGFTGVQGKLGQECFYLFDRESGRLARRIVGLPNVAFNLVYSSDGRWLAASFGEGGIRVYETGGYMQVGEDRDYGAESFSADFDVAGRVVTSCLDGFIRLYERTGAGALRLAAKRKVEGGKLPFSVSLTPDGSFVAVGFQGSTKVAVLSGRDLSLQFAPDNRGVNNGSLDFVTWSADGQTLSAGGTYKDNDENYIICQWAEGGRGRYREIKASRNTVQHLLPLRNGGVIYGASDPAFGLIDAGGQRSLFIGPAIADYGGLLQGFLLSANGAVVQFSYEKYGKSPARFSLADRRFEEASSSAPTLKPPLITGLAITDWNANYAPKLGDQALKLERYEISFSLAIAPDQSRFLLGTAYLLRLYNNKGKGLWEVAIPSVAWSVNISGNGKLVVAAFADGTIRWYRISDGKELLAFYPHTDRKRWVVWTPQGYYDAAPGAEDLIGWHVNNGRDAAADFYPISRFFEQYYRPDIITEVIHSVQTDQEVVSRLGAPGKLNLTTGIKRPPKVSFLSPHPGAQFDREQIDIAVSAQDLGGGVDEMRLFHNGKLISGSVRGQGVAGSSGMSVQRTFTAQLVEGENRFTAIALSQERVESETAELIVTLRGVTQEIDLYLMVIGINRYRNSALNLNYAEADAQGIASFFDSAQSKKLFRRVQVYRLLNEQATLQGIQQAFGQIKSQARPQDTVLIYLAGHGDVAERAWYFVPHDLTTPEMESDLKKGGLSHVMLEEMVKSIQARKFFMMLDACKSGSAVMAMRGYEERKALAQLARSTGIYIISATTDKQLAAETRELGHGVFTYVLLDGLKGKAGAQKITVEGLIQYVKDTLPDMTEKYRGAPQYPVSWAEKAMDFPLVLLGDKK